MVFLKRNLKKEKQKKIQAPWSILLTNIVVSGKFLVYAPPYYNRYMSLLVTCRFDLWKKQWPLAMYHSWLNDFKNGRQYSNMAEIIKWTRTCEGTKTYLANKLVRFGRLNIELIKRLIYSIHRAKNEDKRKDKSRN